MAMNAVARHGVSIALACRAFEISETCYCYSPVLLLRVGTELEDQAQEAPQAEVVAEFRTSC